MISPIKDSFLHFLALAEHRNISRAAAHLGMTQPQLTKILQRLEDEARELLFERTNRGLVLTEAGAQLRDRISQLELAWASATDSQQLITSQIRIGAHSIIARRRVPSLFLKLRQDFPQLSLHFSEISSKDASHLVANGSIDLAIAANPQEMAGLILQEIDREDIAIWAAVDKSNTSSRDNTTLVVNPQVVQHTRLVRNAKYKQMISVENYEIAAEVALKLKCHVLLPEPAILLHKSSFEKRKTLEKVSIKTIISARSRKNLVLSKAREILLNDLEL